MATFRQKRRLARGILALLFVGVIGFLVGPTVIAAYSVPNVEGYLKAAPPGAYTPLSWDGLSKGKWPNNSSPTVPGDIGACDGTLVFVKGFALPLHQAGEADTLFVAKYPRGCYFCNPPGIADVVIVKIAGSRKVPLLDRPVSAYGRLHVAAGSDDDEGLYTITDAVLVINRGLL